MSLFLAAALIFTPAPGVTNPAVTQANIDTTICAKPVKGQKTWTQSIRPPSSYTNKLKLKQLAARGVPSSEASKYEEDHKIPLSWGGHPTNQNNLWPQLWDGPDGAHKKDVLETHVHLLICARKLSLATAQHDIAANWKAAYLKYIGVAP